MRTERALAGKMIAVTRPRHSADGITEVLRGLGATVLSWPVFAIEPIAESKEELAGALAATDWIVFTSANAVNCFFELTAAGSCDGRRVASIGPATNDALTDLGVRPDIVAAVHTAEGLVDAIRNAAGSLAGLTALYPRAEDAREAIQSGLRELGANVVDVVTYRKSGLEGPVSFDASPDAVTFASGSAVRHLETRVEPKASLAKLKRESIAACIGPSTADVAGTFGYETILVAAPHTAQGIVDALVAHYKTKE